MEGAILDAKKKSFTSGTGRLGEKKIGTDEERISEGQAIAAIGFTASQLKGNNEKNWHEIPHLKMYETRY